MSLTTRPVPIRIIAATNDTVQPFEIPSVKKIAGFAKSTWQDAEPTKTDLP
jgi:hypothetical protein